MFFSLVRREFKIFVLLFNTHLFNRRCQFDTDIFVIQNISVTRYLIK